jgi:hypothetical protein
MSTPCPLSYIRTPVDIQKALFLEVMVAAFDWMAAEPEIVPGGSPGPMAAWRRDVRGALPAGHIP